jgi:CarD family transcriptional regulator
MDFVFCVGDKVVYPMYGAGTIIDLEEKVIDGAPHSYYVLSIPVGNLKILVSVKNAESAGIRSIIDSNRLISIIDEVKNIPVSMHENWNQRYKENMEKIKTGNIGLVAEVFRNLRVREREKGLSSAEKKVLSTAKQIILSEIILSHEVERPQAEDILDTVIC